MNLSWQAEVFAMMKDNNISRSDLAEAAATSPKPQVSPQSTSVWC